MLWCNIVLVLYRILTICWLNLNRWTMCTPVEKLRETKDVPHVRTLLPSHAVVWRVCVCVTCTSGTTPRHDEVLLWLLSMRIYIDTSLEPCASYGHHTFSSLLSCSEFSPFQSPACIEDRKSGTPETTLPVSRTPGVSGDQVFWEEGGRPHTTARINYFQALPSDWRPELLWRLPSDASILPDGCSWDCTNNIVQHWLRSMTSCNTLCRLVWMEPSIFSALIPPLCIHVLLLDMLNLVV
jgi:hypothetical protein